MNPTATAITNGASDPITITGNVSLGTTFPNAELYVESAAEASFVATIAAALREDPETETASAIEDYDEIRTIVSDVAPDAAVTSVDNAGSVLLSTFEPEVASFIAGALSEKGYEVTVWGTQVLAAKARKKSRETQRREREATHQKSLTKSAADNLSVLHDSRAIKALSTLFNTYVVGEKDDYRQFIKFLREVDALFVQHRKNVGKTGERAVTPLQESREAAKQKASDAAKKKLDKVGNEDEDEDNPSEDAVA